MLTDPAAWLVPEVAADPALLESNIFVPPSNRTSRVDEVITEPSALPDEEEAISSPLSPNTPLLPDLNTPLELSPPTAPAE